MKQLFDSIIEYFFWHGSISQSQFKYYILQTKYSCIITLTKNTIVLQWDKECQINWSDELSCIPHIHPLLEWLEYSWEYYRNRDIRDIYQKFLTDCGRRGIRHVSLTDTGYIATVYILDE